MKTVPTFDDKVCCFLENICGDKCLRFDDSDRICECGDKTFDRTDYGLYCCIPKNETCKVQGNWQNHLVRVRTDVLAKYVKLSNID